MYLNLKSTYLLQECNQLTSPPFVWFGQIQILEIQHQSLTVFGAIHTSCIGAEYHTGLLEFLKDMIWRGLGTAVYGGYLGGS